MSAVEPLDSSAPLRALIVDDAPELRLLLEPLLAREGFDVRMASDGEERVDLTRIEFDLLAALCQRPRQVCSRGQLLETVWGPNWYGDTHVVDVHMSNLRRKLGDRDRSIRVIQTVRGVGFRLSDDAVKGVVV